MRRGENAQETWPGVQGEGQTPVLADADALAVLMAAGETGLPEAPFPTACPWSYQQTADQDFWPDSCELTRTRIARAT